MASETTLPEDLTTDSVKPVSNWWLISFALAWFGFWLIIMLPGQFMLLQLATVIDPGDKVAISSFLIGWMAAVIVISVPLVGWLIDRSSPKFGRRRTWALVGFVMGAVPFAFVGQYDSRVTVTVLLGLVALGQATVLVSLSAVIADQVPRNQRGRASAAMGVPQVLALAGGMILVTEVIRDVGLSWMVIGALALLAPLPFILFFREPEIVSAPERRRLQRINLAMFKGYGDFGWAALSRVLINVGNLVGTTYLLYFLSDVVKRENAESSLTTLVLFYLAANAIAAWLGGVISDRLKARRVFVAAAGGFQAVAALVLVVTPTWNASIVAAVLLGLGYGLFLSVDQALLTDLLPNEATRSRDLGIVNSAQHLPIAPLVGWFVLNVVGAGYSGLYLVAAIIMILGSVVVFRIRSVR